MFDYDGSIFYYLRFSLNWRIDCFLLFPLFLVRNSSSRWDCLSSLLWLSLSLDFFELQFRFLFSDIFIPVVDHVVKITIALPWWIHCKSVELSSGWRQISFVRLYFWIELNCNLSCLRPVDDVISKDSYLKTSSFEIFICKILMRLNLFLNFVHSFSHDVWVIIHSKLIIQPVIIS